MWFQLGCFATQRLEIRVNRSRVNGSSLPDRPATDPQQILPAVTRISKLGAETSASDSAARAPIASRKKVLEMRFVASSEKVL